MRLKFLGVEKQISFAVYFYLITIDRYEQYVTGFVSDKRETISFLGLRNINTSCLSVSMVSNNRIFTFGFKIASNSSYTEIFLESIIFAFKMNLLQTSKFD